MNIEDYLPKHIVYNSYLGTYYMLYPNDPYNELTEHILYLETNMYEDRVVINYRCEENILNNDVIIYIGNDYNENTIKYCVQNFKHKIGDINHFTQDKYKKRNLILLDLL